MDYIWIKTGVIPYLLTCGETPSGGEGHFDLATGCQVMLQRFNTLKVTGSAKRYVEQ